jgi:hypothetical protein
MEQLERIMEQLERIIHRPAGEDIRTYDENNKQVGDIIE